MRRLLRNSGRVRTSLPAALVRRGDGCLLHRLIEQRHTHCSFDIAILEILALAHLRHDASQKRPSCLCGQQDGGPSDDAKLIVRY
jgi:hypothetical protein